MITEEMISIKDLEIDHGPTTGREKGPKRETEDWTHERETETQTGTGRGREDERGLGPGRGREGERHLGTGREDERGPVRDVGVDLETETTEDPRMIVGEADRKNENLRSITEDHLQVTSSEYSCEELTSQ